VRKYAAADEEAASLPASLHKQMRHGSPAPEAYVVLAHQGPWGIGSDVVREIRRSGGAEALQHPGGHAVRGAAVVRSALPSCSHALGPRPVLHYKGAEPSDSGLQAVLASDRRICHSHRCICLTCICGSVLTL